ncbi:tetratricopeptide repeat protein [Lutibacter sp. HS1-25]|uniref:tetratricopeptide repeat-containing sensor histidine kinase n=1 Tax=Lutibacter sp. HS1-25 TaxID=2485000 RepID=UPI001012827D|nr:tetratricopeptide repeat-containing sensor histidine kinase [Lutibacter sp. HS1-25]RXP60870.1 tetratricopeptide repeat protein [Lutibacter sp. HS1-25]
MLEHRINILTQKCFFHLPSLILLVAVFINFNIGYSQTNSKTESLLSVLKTKTIDSDKAEIYAELCWENRYNDFKVALNYGNKAIEIYSKQKNIAGQCKVLNFLGVSKKQHGDYSAALDYHFKVLDMNIEPDNIEIAYAYNNIGEIYRLLGKNEEAIEYANKALKINELIHNEAGMSYNLILIGSVLGSEEKWDEALIKFKSALQLRVNNGNPERLSIMNYHIGNYFLKLNQPDSALVYYQQSIDGFKKSNGTDMSQIVYGKYYAATKQLQLAEHNLKSAIETLNGKPSEILLELYETLSLVYFEQNDFKNAYLLQLESTQLKDSLFKIDNTRKITQLEKDLEFKIERVKYEADIVKQKRVTYGLIIILLLFVGFAYIIYKSLRFQKRTNQKLHELNQEIVNGKLALEHANKELELSNATKDKFFSIIAHDLKSPFNSIMGFSEILKGNIETNHPEEIKKYANIIYNSAAGTLTLLENLLDWARIQSSKINFEPTKINLCKTVNETINLIGETANKKKVKLINKVSSNIFVKGDENMVSTIVRNLIVNAIKYSFPEGNVIISAKSNVNKIEISIIDNGVGMDEEMVQNLFVLNSGTSTLGTNNEKGTGLGLILCKEFIQMHNEKMFIESETGKGSTFRFTLPEINGG